MVDLDVADRVCASCGNTFKPTEKKKGAWRQKYCAPKCRRIQAKAMHAQRCELVKCHCQSCGVEFEYRRTNTRGLDRKFCSDLECRAKRLRALAGGKPLCVVEGCSNARGYSSGICNSCYYRLKRTGTLERKQFAYRSMHSTGYISVVDPSHPLSSKQGRVFEHRKVLFASIGDGPHPCHWCGEQVNWVKDRCITGALVPDHLDGDKANNDISNLVPACNRCNTARGLFMSWVVRHHDDPVIWEMYERFRRKAG